jgi:glycosyltransferase involved in cell wall biosynthesis
VPDEACIKVPAASRASTAAALADAIEKLARDPLLRQEMGLAGWNYAASQLWSQRAAQMSALYRRVAVPPHAPGAVTQAGPHGVAVQP